MASAASAGPTSRLPPLDPLLGTKLHVRPLRSGLVSRPRLLALLDQGLTCPLTLVSAPAGFGKTTLLAEWLTSRPLNSCWLSLDAADNDPARFLTYVIAALQVICPGLAEDLVPCLRAPQPPSVATVVATLVNELASIPDDLVLVLDDFHVVTSRAVSNALTLLLENLPSNVHLVILTRSDPPLPIARLRARGQVLEIRAEELRFTPDEAALFLDQTMGLALSPEQVRALEERTEGWVAGLQMAALSMRGRDDLEGFVRAFAGTNRFILDFLVEEVLSREPVEVKTFLLETSTLTRLSGPLCDAVTERADSQEMLERLEKSNLFVVALDDERRWYRYHHLFADLLRAGLQQTWPDRVPELHRRARDWHECNGLTGEAIRHALAGGEEDRANQLIEQSIDSTLLQGQFQLLLGWLEALPPEAFDRRPRLQLCRALALIRAFRLNEATRCLDSAERGLDRQEESDSSGHAQGSEHSEGRAGEARGMLAVARAVILANEGEPARALELASSALGHISSDSLVWRGVGCVVAGDSCGLVGDLARSDAFLAEARAIAERTDNVGLLMTVLHNSAHRELVTGRLRRASEVYDELLRLAVERGGRALHSIAGAQAELAMLLEEWNDLEAALHHADQALTLGRLIGNPAVLATGRLALVRVRIGRGDLAGALKESEELVRQAGKGEIAPYRPAAEALRARIWLGLGDLASASVWAEETARTLAGVGEPARPPPHPYEYPLATLVRVRLAEGRADEARRIVRSALPLARVVGRIGREIELLGLEALALGASGSKEPALDTLKRALALAEPEGYARTFLDEGRPLAALLARLLASLGHGEGDSEIERYARKLLGWFGDAADARPSSSLPASTGIASTSDPDRAGRGERAVRSPTSVEPLVEPLSARELEVLELMAEGLTNEQIASRLIIALGTVKAHVHNISGKLGAQNRAQAVARGKELDLL